MNLKKRVALVVGFVAALAIAIAWGSMSGSIIAQRGGNLTVSAAISLTNAMQEIKPLYERNQQAREIRYNFGSSGALQRQIEQGAPVDVFLSAGKRQMDALEEQNLLLSGSRQDLLRNRMVLITPKNGSAIANFRDLLASDIKRVAIGEPRSVPAGQYAREVLVNLDIYDDLRPKMVFGNNVRQVLTFVETGNVDAGIVYITDALQSDGIAVRATASENLHSPIVYPVAAIKNTQNAEASKDYLRFLFTDAAKAVFEKYGFSPLS